MGRTAAAGIWSLGRALARTARYCIGLPSPRSIILVLAGLTLSLPCGAQDLAKQDPVKGEASFSAAGGYARLGLKLAPGVESEGTPARSIIVIRVHRPAGLP